MAFTASPFVMVVGLVAANQKNSDSYLWALVL